jgi:hypothetical protein
MAQGGDKELNILAIEHYRQAISMFIEHLGSSGRELWLTFPALWLFIHYEQQYGDDPRDLQRHLEGVRDVVASHGEALFPGSADGFTTMDVAGQKISRHILDRLALWTIYHDAQSSSFGFAGSLIKLLQEQYPGAITRIRHSSKSMIKEAWGDSYPAEEELWDLRITPMEDILHECTLRRYELSKFETGEREFDPKEMIEFGNKLRRIENVRI